MKIQLTKEITDKARELAEEFTKLNVEGKEKHIFKTEDNFEKKRIGFIGELAVEEYLKQSHIFYEKDDVLFKKDKFDFKIGSKTFDVKTTYWQTYKKHDTLLINQEQAERKKVDYYIYVVIHMDKAEIWGFISADEVLCLELNTNLPSPAYVLEKEDLTRIKKLRDLL